MTGMKNGVRKTQKTRLRLDLSGVDLKTYSLLAAFGLLAAFAVQRMLGPAELLGAFLLSALLLFMFYKDMLRYKPRFINDYGMLLLLGSLIVGTLYLGRLSGYVLEGLARGFGRAEVKAAVFGIPMPAGAMLVTLLFDFHTAIFFSFIISLFGGLWLSDASYSVYIFVGSLTAAFGVIRCKKRTAILKSGMYVLGANILTVAMIYLFNGRFVLPEFPLAMAFAVFCAVAVIAVVSILLPALEYAFNVKTDISLLELLDLDQPLMKSLMVSAPGTYHHSIIVGNLVDSVSESVGVNPLLARVAAYYHDVGKLKMPEYFIENSPAAVSKHERLTPHMSSMILISHVKEGVELAREHKLPRPVTDIIQQHHGSSLITYFYHKARGLEHSDELTEEEYKYPGPKPQTRVAALVMMADAVEAASRVLTDSTPARVSSLVDKIIDHMYLEGQLDECELMLKDIYEVKKRFTHILIGILHKRVDYPGFDFEGKNGDEGRNSQHPKEDKAKPEADKERLAEGPQHIRAQRG
ncbi:MAG: HDIG domain-containing protein [Thermodesulfovibrionales bacterium]|nr:HDIG domain-containing protein [Thermodesulfovibrionales bacterium]